MNTDRCGECDLEVPCYPEYRLIHLFREHPAEFLRIEREYCDHMTGLNDVSLRPVSESEPADLRERLETVASRSITMGGQS